MFYSNPISPAQQFLSSSHNIIPVPAKPDTYVMATPVNASAITEYADAISVHTPTPGTASNGVSLKCSALEDKLHNICSEGNAGLCPMRRRVVFDCFDELIQQITADCPERAHILNKIRYEIGRMIDSHVKLYAECTSTTISTVNNHSNSSIPSTNDKISYIPNHSQQLHQFSKSPNPDSPLLMPSLLENHELDDNDNLKNSLESATIKNESTYIEMRDVRDADSNDAAIGSKNKSELSLKFANSRAARAHLTTRSLLCSTTAHCLPCVLSAIAVCILLFLYQFVIG